MMSIAENIKAVKGRIEKACGRANRNPEDVTLVAVSKTFPAEKIIEAAECGITDIGENRVQDAFDKYCVVGNRVRWHFIGHLQKNKVKYIIQFTEFIHSVDSMKLAVEIAKRAESINKVQKVLLEIKTSNEATKFGLTQKDEIFRVAGFCEDNKNIDLQGLMTMAPFVNDEKIIRDSFSRLRNLLEELNKNGFNLKHLSMGMTNDYEIAIEEGATMLRIGSAIFGRRDYSKSWDQS